MTDFVTRDEFGRLHDDVREIRRDVKRLLARDAGAIAVERERTAFWASIGTKSTLLLTLVTAVSLILSAAATAHTFL